MGLDRLELKLEVEEAFDIKVPDETIENWGTVGDLYRIILGGTDTGPQNRCLSAKVFRSIRQHAKQFGVQHRLRPSTPLDGVIPKQGRDEFWFGLSQATGFELPRLRRVVSAQAGAASLAFVLVASLLSAFLTAQFSQVAAFTAYIVTAAMLGGLMLRLNTRYETEFPSEWNTFRGLTENVIANNGRKLRDVYGPFNEAEIWTVLQAIVAGVLGVDKKLITKDARLIEDLGMD